ncbi:MAG: hypothetical protein CMM49_05525 [Rhodospirillaceae bacterium]|nr:hypothetical protein [Rhodospirillaceae bacterium]|tara:strand:- start:1803 stop:2606 length:804 start_codon:yes stop_codon:yes gene_type:complete
MKNNLFKCSVFFILLVSFFSETEVHASSKSIQSHLAVYEIKLNKSRSKEINDARGRLVIEVRGSCKGFFQKQRMILKLNNPNGLQFFSDYNYYAWESINGDKLSFSNKNFLNSKLIESFTGNAVRDSKEIFVTFENNDVKNLTLSREVLFPMQYFIDLINLSKKEIKFTEKKIYDGSGPDGIYNAIAFISESKKNYEDKKYLSQLKDLESWWLNIAYFSQGNEIMIPEYQAEFNLYSNGVINNLTLDYGRFIIDTRLVKLEYMKSDC